MTDSPSVRDLVIIGGGPAGLSASIYATRAMLDAVTIEQTAIGGQVILTTDIDNDIDLDDLSFDDEDE